MPVVAAVGRTKAVTVVAIRLPVIEAVLIPVVVSGALRVAAIVAILAVGSIGITTILAIPLVGTVAVRAVAIATIRTGIATVLTIPEVGTSAVSDVAIAAIRTGIATVLAIPVVGTSAVSAVAGVAIRTVGIVTVSLIPPVFALAVVGRAIAVVTCAVILPVARTLLMLICPVVLLLLGEARPAQHQHQRHRKGQLHFPG